jgi:RimJ/RimL family protein N-acetyltransferase
MTVRQPMTMHLTTDRLTLRPWTESDVDDYLLLVMERDDRSRVLERGDVRPSVDNIRARISSQLESTQATGIALLPVIRRTKGDFIGYCGLIVGRTSIEEPEIAFELLRRVHGNGYATEAARAVVEAAVASGRARLWATVGAWNAPSFRVLDKLGFRRDHVTHEDNRGELVWMTLALE